MGTAVVAELVDLTLSCPTACPAVVSVAAEMYSLGPKPALIRQPEGSGGGSLELEVWEMPIEKVG
jgi:hypothetical protein